LSEAVTAGEMGPGVKIYLGRTIYDGIYVVGRIQEISPWGLYHVSAWKTHRLTSNIDYMRRKPGQTFSWVHSQNGVAVPHSIIPGYTPGRIACYFGRVNINGRTYLGKIIPGGDMHYENDNGNEVPITHYEALTCTFDRNSKISNAHYQPQYQSPFRRFRTTLPPCDLT
jgi:hypothetical protein